MTAYAVITRERTTDIEALARYREKATLSLEKHPVDPIAFYGLHEVLEGGPVEGVAILSFPSMEAHGLGTLARNIRRRFRTACMAVPERCTPSKEPTLSPIP